MTVVTKCIWPVVFLVGTAGAAPAAAIADTRVSYDCDAPVDQAVSLPKAVTLPITLAGTISVQGMKSRDYVPSISVAAISGDDASGAGFQLSASDDDAKDLELALITQDGDDDVETVKGRVPVGPAIPFTLSVAASGEAVIVVNDITFTASIKPGADVKVSAICTSGHFGVTGLFAGTESPAAAGGSDAARP